MPCEYLREHFRKSEHQVHCHARGTARKASVAGVNDWERRVIGQVKNRKYGASNPKIAMGLSRGWFCPAEGFWSHNGGARVFYWRLASRSQGCCQTSYNVQDSCSPNPNPNPLSGPNINRTTEFWLLPWYGRSHWRALSRGVTGSDRF